MFNYLHNMKQIKAVQGDQSMCFIKYLAVFICVLAASTALASSADAKTYYVSVSGDDKGDGSIDSPFLTINKALKAGLVPGDVVMVRPGVYKEGVYISKSGSAGAYITFRSETPGAAKIVVPKNIGFFIAANYIRIDGFNISQSSQAGITGHAVHHIEILNNISHDNKGAGIYFGRSDFLKIIGNVTHNNAANAVTSGISVHMPQNVSGDTTTKGPRIIVRGNVSYNNLTVTAGHTDGNGIIFDDFLLRNKTINGQYSQFPDIKPYTYPALIENNVVYRNGGSGITVYASNNITVRNNTAWHNSRDPLAKGTWRGEFKNMSGSNNYWINNLAVSDLAANKDNTGIAMVSFKDMPNENVVWMNNLTFNGTPGDKSIRLSGSNVAPSGNGNLFGVDPVFVNAPYNFRLRSMSSAVDAGTLKFGSSATDVKGGPRVVNTIDIGAYERE